MSDRSVYKQIADVLRRRIEMGDFAPGARLPSESVLMRDFDVSGGTVRQAVAVLRSEGLVQARQGRGVFVRARPQPRRLVSDGYGRRVREQRSAASMAKHELEISSVDVYKVGSEEVGADITKWLGVPVGTKVLARRSQCFIDGQPTELTTSYIPMDVADAAGLTQAGLDPGSISIRIEETGRRLGRITEDVTARMPTPDESRTLNLMTGVPVLALVRVTFDVNDVAVEVCDTVIPADQFSLAYERHLG